MGGAHGALISAAHRAGRPRLFRRAVAAGAAVALIAWAVSAYRASAPIAEQDPFAGWTPTAETIYRTIDAGSYAGQSKARQKAMREEFARAFQSRYRQHDPMVAIGLRFEPNGHIKLMFPARMEPWAMDRVARAAWTEAGAAFGTRYPVDIYETFIGLPPVRIGSLRWDAAAPTVAHISYHWAGPDLVHATAGDR